jgi:hypothetical protein
MIASHVLVERAIASCAARAVEQRLVVARRRGRTSSHRAARTGGFAHRSVLARLRMVRVKKSAGARLGTAPWGRIAGGARRYAAGLGDLGQSSEQLLDGGEVPADAAQLVRPGLGGVGGRLAAVEIDDDGAALGGARDRRDVAALEGEEAQRLTGGTAPSEAARRRPPSRRAATRSSSAAASRRLIG